MRKAVKNGPAGQPTLLKNSQPRSLAEFFGRSPLVNLKIKLRRKCDLGRKIEL